MDLNRFLRWRLWLTEKALWLLKIVLIINKSRIQCFCCACIPSAATRFVAALLELRVVKDELLAALARVHSTLHFLVTAHIIYLLHEGLKAVSHIRVGERTGLNEKKIMFAGELLCTPCGDSALRRIALADVQFVADEHEHNLWLRVVLHLVYPLFYIFESLLLCYVVNQQGPQTLPVVSRRYCLESFLTSCMKNRIVSQISVKKVDWKGGRAAAFMSRG